MSARLECQAEAGYCVCDLSKGHFEDHRCVDCGAWPTAALELDHLRHDYNCAVANGLIIKAKSIDRHIEALASPRHVDPWASRQTHRED